MSKKSLVKDITFGVCGTILDLLLWQVALVGASVGKTGSRGVYQAFQEADEFINKVNHKTLAAVWYQLTKKKLLTYKKRGNLYSPLITEFGKKRLQEVIPKYHPKRPWDKKIYMINYDIPEKARKKRDNFRNYLKQVGCRFLQESTWFTPYNPRQLVKEFIKENRIPGTIIVSDIGKDGGIGEESLQDLLIKLYSLENLNDRYEGFIKNVKEEKMPLRNLIFEYFSILKDDPQLPFELLPPTFAGEKAYCAYQKLIPEYILKFRGRTRYNI